jgi:hypothetical protein
MNASHFVVCPGSVEFNEPPHHFVLCLASKRVTNFLRRTALVGDYMVRWGPVVRIDWTVGPEGTFDILYQAILL